MEDIPVDSQFSLTVILTIFSESKLTTFPFLKPHYRLPYVDIFSAILTSCDREHIDTLTDIKILMRGTFYNFKPGIIKKMLFSCNKV